MKKLLVMPWLLGARALADACTAHAMEGAPMNAIDTALLKAKSALRRRRRTSETNKMVRSGGKCAQAAIDAVFKGAAR